MRQCLHRVIRVPVAAGLSPLVGILQPSLNSALSGLPSFKLRRAGQASCGGPLWAPYMAMMDYAARVLGVPLERSLIDAVEQAGPFWMLDGLVFAAARPTHINRDTEGLFHCELGPSLAYQSDWAWWHWHGVPVPQKVIEEPQQIALESITEASHPALRRVMIERYRWGADVQGIAAYLRDSAPRPLDQDPAFGTLWRLGGPREPLLVVEVRNHSPEPDGSYRRFFLGVDPELRPILRNGSLGAPQALSARNAIAATFGLRGAEYMPKVET